jgi:hypothetical protein
MFKSMQVLSCTLIDCPSNYVMFFLVHFSHQLMDACKKFLTQAVLINLLDNDGIKQVALNDLLV